MVLRLFISCFCCFFLLEGMQESNRDVFVLQSFEKEKDSEMLEAIFKNDYKNLINDSHEEYSEGDGVKTFITLVTDATINERKILCVNNKAVAFLIYFVLYKNTLNKNFYDGDVALALMGVHPNERNKKYGTRVMNYFMKCALNLKAEKVWLSVEHNHHTAHRLYKKFGFVDTNIVSWGNAHWWSAYTFNNEISKRALYDRLIEQKNCDLNINFL